MKPIIIFFINKLKQRRVALVREGIAISKGDPPFTIVALVNF
jgi:hypothetical protein